MIIRLGTIHIIRKHFSGPKNVEEDTSHDIGNQTSGSKLMDRNPSNFGTIEALGPEIVFAIFYRYQKDVVKSIRMIAYLTMNLIKNYECK